MRILWRAALLALAVVLAVFAISNRGTVSLGLWPLPDMVAIPLYLVIIGALLVGFLAGEVAAWLAGRHWRREARQSARRIAALERELETARTIRRGDAEIAAPEAHPLDR